MKAVPKVNTDGLYLEDELVDDAFSGVAPFFSSLSLRHSIQKHQNKLRNRKTRRRLNQRLQATL
ncbi:hypothetical protein ABIC22_000761 [Paenibacillus sp. PvP094]